MIEAKDLRLGVTIKYSNDPYLVEMIHGQPITVDMDIFIEAEQRPNLFDPIPLTHECLLAIGFTYTKIEGIASLGKEQPEGDTHNWTLKIKKEKDSIYDGDRCAIELVKWGDDPKDKIYFADGHWLRVEMRHLHQLQNLYFALTGLEISYKPV